MRLTPQRVGPTILGKIKIYVLTRAELLIPLCYEIPCIKAKWYTTKQRTVLSAHFIAHCLSLTDFSLVKKNILKKIRFTLFSNSITEDSCTLIRTKRSSVLLLCLTQIKVHQSLFEICKGQKCHIKFFWFFFFIWIFRRILPN